MHAMEKVVSLNISRFDYGFGNIYNEYIQL